MSFIGDIDNLLDIPSGIRGDDYFSVNKFGRTTNLDSGASNNTDIWDGASTPANRIWIPPTTARTHDIASSVGSDSAAGTGMRTVRIQGLDANFDLQEEDITLNGTTNVPTVNTYTRIFRMFGLTWGTGQVNGGIITATAQTDATITAQINTGNNQTLMAIYTVPNGYTAFMTRYYCSVNRNSPSNVSFDLQLLIKNNVDISNSGYRIGSIRGMYINQNHLDNFYKPYSKITEKTDIVLRGAECTDNNTDVSAGFDLIVINNNVL